MRTDRGDTAEETSPERDGSDRGPTCRAISVSRSLLIIGGILLGTIVVVTCFTSGRFRLVTSLLKELCQLDNTEQVNNVCRISLQVLGSHIRDHQESQYGRNPDEQELYDSMADVWTNLGCPESFLDGEKVPYVYRGSDLSKEAARDLVVLYCDKAWHKGRRNVLFADFRVGSFTNEEFSKVIGRDNELRRQRGLEEKPSGQ